MQDEVNERSVSLSVRGARMGAEALARTMRAFLESRRRNRAAPGKTVKSKSKNRTGVMSMKALAATGAELEQATLAEGGVGSFARVARRYHVAYSVMKDKSQDQPRWIVFFKARDAAQMEAAFNAYAKQVLDGKDRQKPSVVEQVKRIAQSMPRPGKQEKQRDQERGGR